VTTRQQPYTTDRVVFHKSDRLSMSAFVQIISCGTADTDPCVVIGTEHERHLFNVGEGIQRLCMEHKVRVNRFENIYLSHVGADSVGGLPGMIITLAEYQKAPGVTLHGPPGLHKTHAAHRHVFSRPNFNVQVREGAGQHNTKQLLVEKLQLDAAVTAEQQQQQQQLAATAASASSPSNNGSEQRRWTPWAAPPPGPAAPLSCMCYIARTPDSPGKFNAQRAQELGVPRGPLCGKLKNGATITLSCGRQVTPAEVSQSQSC
jgi:ribonuclease Z